jgi:hypothetical protein
MPMHLLNPLAKTFRSESANQHYMDTNVFAEGNWSNIGDLPSAQKGQPMAQPLMCPTMPMMWPVGQTAEGGMVYASVVPPTNPDAQIMACYTSPELRQQTNEEHRRHGPNASVNSRWPRQAKPAPASTDALTTDEIEEMRMAVENARRKLQSPESFVPQRQDFTRFAGVKSPPKSKESDEFSSSSSTRMESEDAADDDVHSNLVCGPANVVNEYRISDADVDSMFLELECLNFEKRKAAIEWIIASTRPLALTRRGCRIVQRAMEVASSPEQERIVANLQGFVLEALQSPHANYVLQKCFEVMPPLKLQFVLRELKGQGIFVARHRFGCRIIQRSIERCTAEQNEDLITEILMDAPQLVRHTYGNFVIQHILQYGTPKQVHQIAEVLLTDAIRFAKHRIASHVMSCAVSCCSPVDVQNLTDILLGEKAQSADLMHRQYGSYVVREVNRVSTRLQ